MMETRNVGKCVWCCKPVIQRRADGKLWHAPFRMWGDVVHKVCKRMATDDDFRGWEGTVRVS